MRAALPGPAVELEGLTPGHDGVLDALEDVDRVALQPLQGVDGLGSRQLPGGHQDVLHLPHGGANRELCTHIKSHGPGEVGAPREHADPGHGGGEGGVELGGEAAAGGEAAHHYGGRVHRHLGWAGDGGGGAYSGKVPHGWK